MTAKEGYEKIMNWIPDMKCVACYEYETVFVYQMVPSDYKGNGTLFSGLFSVNKKNGDINSFKPFNIPITEYRNGKRVDDFQ